MCSSQKDGPSAVSHFAFTALLMLVTFQSGSSLRHNDGDRSSCSVPRSLGCFCDYRTHRTYIKCEGVHLTEVPRNFSRPESLRMSRTRLQLNDGVPYRSLTDLRIESNVIPHIGDGAFDRLENLITLILVDNQIRVLTGRTFAGLRSLEFLNLEGNTIVHIKADVFSGLNMPNLKILKLSDCGISHVDPHSFSGLQHLALLDLSWNKVEKIPVMGDSEGLPSLASLELSNNHLYAVNNATFQYLPSVRHLYLSHNRISILQRSSFTRSMQKTLLSLYLRYNGLAVVETPAIGQLESLTTLDISFNNLRTLASDDIPDNVEKILIHDNPWSCKNCENGWILRNPNVRNWNEESSVTCGWPHRGRSFFNTSLSSSECDQRLPIQRPPFLSKTMTVSNDARRRYFQIVWISTASLLVTFTCVTAAIYMYLRCIRGHRCHRQASKAHITKKVAAAESKQCLVTDDNA